MLETGVIREFQPGVFSFTLPPCSTAVLPLILDATIPFVWVVGHWPGTHVHWWEAELPLSEATPNRRLRVRDVKFDIQMSTADFFQCEPEFRHGGIILRQLDRPVPDTLCVGRSPDAADYRVLRHNGLHLEVHLPHPGEYASVISPHRHVLESLLTKPELAAPELP